MSHHPRPPHNDHRPTTPAGASAGIALTSDGVEIVHLDDVFDGYVLKWFWREVVFYLLTGNDVGIREFAGIRVGGRELLSDPHAVHDWFHRHGKFSR